MGLSFANTAALWGLLGLPVVLAIHFLQSRNRREEISSLFLLNLLPEETQSGAVFTYLRNGLQLWMQLLAVLLFTLLLARPMWLHEESFQSVAVVLDTSASMQAFQEEVSAFLERTTDEIDQTAGETEWWLQVSDPTRPHLLQAGTREELLKALNDFQPLSGPHSARPALIRARQLVGEEGLVLYISDHPSLEVPAGAVSVSVGKSLVNSGFSGFSMEEGKWKASLVHFGPEALHRELRVVVDGKEIERRTVLINPGAVKVEEGELPDAFERGMLLLESDAFTPDNQLPFVQLVEKPLVYKLELPEAEKAFAERLLATLPGAMTGSTHSLIWKAGWPLEDELSVAAEIWWLNGEDTGPFRAVVPAEHDLTRDLSWEGFLALPFTGFNLLPNDSVLLWMGESPLVIQRSLPGGTRLLLNFDFATSNSERFPSMLLFLHRFLRQQRDQQPLPFQTNFETGQLIAPFFQTVGTLESAFEGLQGTGYSESNLNPDRLHAPDRPGYFSVKAGEEILLEAGVFFGNVSEGDFREAKETPFPKDTALKMRKRNSQTDFLMPLWFSLLVLVLGLSWWSGKNGGNR